MKYLALLATVLIIYVVLAHRTPVADVKEAMAQTEVQPLAQGAAPLPPARSNALKRPLDRTHEVLGQVKAQNGQNEF